jgi:hypothetical protein
MTVADIRERWNLVLDHLEREDRIAWIAYFDGRVDSFDNNRLTLDFRDSQKLASGHDYFDARVRLRSTIQGVIYDVLGINVVVVEK